MKSKFSFRSFFPAFCFIGITTGLIGYIEMVIINAVKPPPLNGIPLVVLLSFTLLWLFFGEFKSKMIKIELYETDIFIRKYGGLGNLKTYLYSELDGFKRSVVDGQGEYIYLINGGRKIGKISNFYHANYSALKDTIIEKLTDLGTEKNNLASELKDTFS